jgi:hypothetical protein
MLKTRLDRGEENGLGEETERELTLGLEGDVGWGTQPIKEIITAK